MAGLPQFIISTQTDPYWEIPLFDAAGNPLSVQGRVFEAWIAPATTRQGVSEPVPEIKVLTFQDGLSLVPQTDGGGDQTVKNTFVHQISRAFAQANFPRGELTADLLEVVGGARRMFAPVRLFYGDPAQIRDFIADRQGITFGQGRQAIVTPVAIAGQAGRRGSGLLTGTQPPQPSDGEDGDYWVVERTGQANVIYGPKEAGEWPAQPSSTFGVGGVADVPGLPAAIDATAQRAANLADLDDKTAARGNIGLGSVDNTSDAAKPVSIAQGMALAGKLATTLMASFTGAVLRPVTDILFAQCHAVIWGVEANTGTDQGPALRRAIAWAQSRGADLILPCGDITLGPDPADAEAVLRITRLMGIRGEGRATRLIPNAACGDRHVILVKPAANAGGIRGLHFRDFSIGTLGQTRFGGDGIRLDTTNLNGFIAKPTIERISVAAAGVGKRAIRHVNNADPATGNRNGGVFGGTFQDSDLFGGVQFDETGDSNNIFRNIIAGPGIGIEYRAISGAATHIFDSNNITSVGGAIYARGSQVKILRNQMEQSAPYTGTDGAMIVLDAAQDWTIIDNNMNAYDRVDCVLTKGSSTFGVMESNSAIYADNHVLYRAIGSQQNTIGRQRRDTRLANATYDANGNYVSGTFTTRNRPLTSLDTASEPTFGIYQKLALQNGWGDGANTNFYQGLFVTRTPDGTLRLRGHLTTGTLTAGTTIAQLPGALYPEKVTMVAAKLTGTPWTLAMFQILPSGQINVVNVGAAGAVYWDDVSASRN